VLPSWQGGKPFRDRGFRGLLGCFLWWGRATTKEGRKHVSLALFLAPVAEMDLYTVLLLAVTAFVIVLVKSFFGSSGKSKQSNSRSVTTPSVDQRDTLHIVYATQQGTARKYAQKLGDEASKLSEVKVWFSGILLRILGCGVQHQIIRSRRPSHKTIRGLPCEYLHRRHCP
jgi:hypothetical protein